MRPAGRGGTEGEEGQEADGAEQEGEDEAWHDEEVGDALGRAVRTCQAPTKRSKA
jgi:hypothetical protein